MDGWSLDTNQNESAGADGSPPVAVVATRGPVTLRVEDVTVPGTPDGATVMASRIGPWEVARSLVETGVLGLIRDSRLLERPARLALMAWEETWGVRARIFVLLPLPTGSGRGEAWSVDLARYESSPADLDFDDPEHCIWIPLGYVTRPRSSRIARWDLEAEASDLLRERLGHGRAIERAIEDLIRPAA